MCEGGLVRSHALVWILKTQHGQDAVACGWRWNSNETLEALARWADYVILMQEEFTLKLPDEVVRSMGAKVRVVDVGPDRWCNPLAPELHEFLNKVVDRTFAQAARAGILPPAPPELQGQPLRTRYISALAMAQRAVANNGIDNFNMFIGGLMKMGLTTAADNYNVDEAVHEYARNSGISPKLVVPIEQVAQARAAHQQQQEQMQRAQMAQTAATAANQGSQAASNLAEAPAPNGGSLLGNAASAVTGGGTPPV